MSSAKFITVRKNKDTHIGQYVDEYKRCVIGKLEFMNM